MKTFYEAIYEWVVENFGQSEADDPSWNIKALADHLSKTDIKPDELNAYTKLQAYDKIKESYLDEDIDYAANDRGVELTNEERSLVKHCYYKLEDETYEQLSMIIGDIIAERKEIGKNETV